MRCFDSWGGGGGEGRWPSGRVSADSRSERLGIRYLPPLCCVLEQRHIYYPKNTGNTQEAMAQSCMTEKLLTGT